MAAVSLVLELALLHYLPTHLTKTAVVSDRYACAPLCMYNSTCLSIIYNTRTGDCYFYDKHATDADATAHPVNSDVVMYSQRMYESCSDVPAGSQDGIYTIKGPDGNAMSVWCDMSTDGGKWLVFQRRTDATENFNRGWNDYKNGFGDITQAFWLGNDMIHALTSKHQYELRIDMTDKVDATNYVKYSGFSLGSEAEKYVLHVQGHSGGPGVSSDSFYHNNGLMFSTFDSDNDPYSSLNCAQHTGGGWWVHKCGATNLNGRYGDDGRQKGIFWSAWHGEYYSLTACEMKIRRI